ncbi:hypothetical protein HY994_02975 [Candidatus Micrarchaeota archaeon]|nr:hypothetical protein [Candidatus Micrarchaeota archaeon]
MMADTEKQAATHHALAEKTIQKHADQWTNQDICNAIQDIQKSLQELVAISIMPTMIDSTSGSISQDAEVQIRARMKITKTKRPAAEYFSILTTGTDAPMSRSEEIGAMRLAAKAETKNNADESFDQLGKKTPELADQVRAHAQKFAWTNFSYSGPALSPQIAWEKIRQLTMEKSEKELTENANALQNRSESLEKQHRQYETELQLDHASDDALNFARQSMRLKLLRKDGMMHGNYATDLLLREVGRRTGLSMNQLSAAQSKEIDAILAGRFDTDRLSKRQACAAYFYENKKPLLLEGNLAKKRAEKEFTQVAVNATDQLRGQCACPGVASGTVRIIDKAQDMDKMRRGDILVSIATTPEIVPVMKKAAAIVTNIGGLTSHAAIVSRELGVPCVIGTKIATKWLKNGDHVEVDATEGVVRKLGK